MKGQSGWAQALLSHPELLILDTETTDLNGYIVQLSVLRARDGAVALDTLVNPEAPIAPGAQRVHGITAEQVATAPTFAAIEPQLRDLLHGRPVAIYNAEFDTGVLQGELMRIYNDRDVMHAWMDNVWWIDVMHPYSQWVNEEGYNGYRWQKLPGGDHTALGDCQACLVVLWAMAGM